MYNTSKLSDTGQAKNKKDKHQPSPVWQPQARQRLFMERPEWEALYGGAAGGGKSEALVMEALRQVRFPHYRALILRKTFGQLKELEDKAQKYYPRLYPGAKFNGSTHTWLFPSGAKIMFGAMQYDKDKTKYQGQAYDFIAFDELTHFTLNEYTYMFSRCRPSGPGTRCYIRATANPGGVGHAWVKERFITAGEPMTPIYETVSWRDSDGTEHTGTRSRIFVPAKVTDNQILLARDPNYLLSLASLPEAERKALLDGNWDSFSGQVFHEWVNDPTHRMDRIGTHVVAPFVIPDNWPIWCGLDWGYSRPFAVVWFAISPEGKMVGVRELYGMKPGCPNVGVQWDVATVAERIRETEADDTNLKGRKIFRVGDPAIWQCDGTESIGALLERHMLYFARGDHARRPGKMQVHNRLAFDARGYASLIFFDTMRETIRTLPQLVYSAHDVEDVDTACEDHLYDAMRYVLMEHPLGARPQPCDNRARVVHYNPFA